MTVYADVWVSDWNGLQDAVKKAANGQAIALSGNISAGGADRSKVDGKTITLDLNGYTMDRGRTSQGDDGHVIEVVGKSNLTIKDSKGTGVIKGGWAKRGGGINVASGSTCTLEGGAIAGNKAKWGGGVYSHGTFRMTGGRIAGNDATASGVYNEGVFAGSTAIGSGGGVYNKGTLTLSGGSITGNTSRTIGGCVEVSDSTSAVNISGGLVVNDNVAGKGANLYLESGKTLTVSGAMTKGARVGVSLEDDLGAFADSFAEKNPNELPETYFASDEHYVLALLNGQAVLAELEPDPDDSGDFIPSVSRVASYENLNSKNWMSGISGERTLNEINNPGTHDSSMNKLKWHRMQSVTTMFGFAENARTQYLYIDEQLDAGYCYIDLRVNNRYERPELLGMDVEQVDDGKNLYLCHGKAVKHGVEIGTIWGANRDGSNLTLDLVLDWIKTFLRRHPSETIILSFTVETPKSEDVPTIKSRTRKILKRLSGEINPSTGKRLLKGTEITIPDCIYKYDSGETGRGFQSWNVTGEAENGTVMPGETFVVMATPPSPASGWQRARPLWTSRGRIWTTRTACARKRLSCRYGRTRIRSTCTPRP